MLVSHTGSCVPGLVCNRPGRDTTVDELINEHFVLVHMPLSGTARLKHPKGERTLGAELAGVTSPGSPFRVVWNDDCEQLIVRVARDRVEHVGRGIVGASYHVPIVFNPEWTFERPAVRHGGTWSTTQRGTLQRAPL